MQRFAIRYKLTLGVVILVCGVSISVGYICRSTIRGVFHDRTERLVRDRKAEQISHSKAVTRYVGTAAQDAIDNTEALRLTRILISIKQQNPRIQYAAFADHTGNVLAQSDMSVDEVFRQNRQVEVSPTSTWNEVPHKGSKVGEVSHPIETDNTIKGMIIIAWSLKDLESDVVTIKKQETREVDFADRLVLSVGIAAVCISIVAGFLGAAHLTRRIYRLSQTAKRISDGELSARANIRGRDEIGVLAATMDHMAERVETLIEETQVRVKLEQELTVARQIQQAMLPSREVVTRPGLHFCGLVESASQCGGDWWSYRALTRERTVMLVGDVTGHGISSAMITATAKSCLDTVSRLTRDDFRVGDLLQIMDQLLRESGTEKFHMTCFAALADPLEKTLTYANAGHNHPYILRRTDSKWRHGRLQARGNRLGDADGHAFVEHTITTTPDDLLCLYSDGLIEGQRSDGKEFGSRRLRAALERIANSPLNEGLTSIVDQFQAFCGETPLADDVTCVIARIV